MQTLCCVRARFALRFILCIIEEWRERGGYKRQHCSAAHKMARFHIDELRCLCALNIPYKFAQQQTTTTATLAVQFNFARSPLPLHRRFVAHCARERPPHEICKFPINTPRPNGWRARSRVRACALVGVWPHTPKRFVRWPNTRHATRIYVFKIHVSAIKGWDYLYVPVDGYGAPG